MINYIITTRRTVLETLKSQGYYIIGVDGTVPNSADLYDELYDHHREDGAPIQMDELPDQCPGCDGRKIAIVSTMVDADAICSAFMVVDTMSEISPEQINLLRAVSFDCDHLTVPAELAQYSEEAPMIVAALKETSNSLVTELGLPSDRRTWSVEMKEKYASAAFSQGIQLITDLLTGKWDYKTVAAPYWTKVTEITQKLAADPTRITIYKDCLIFDGRGLDYGYIDPRCWLRAAQQLGLTTNTPITLTVRDFLIEGKVAGCNYTIGSVPLHPKLVNLDLTSVYPHLTQIEGAPWGGRRTVGGSPWNSPSQFSPTQVIDELFNTSFVSV